MTKDEALKLALEALEAHADIGSKSDKAITAIKEALTQPEQEPVGEVVNATDKAFECRFVKILPIGTKFYTTSPQRTWVGLTDEDWDKIFGNALTIGEAIKVTEAKLKQKNGYAEENT